MAVEKKGDYSAQWAEYRRRRNIFLLVFVTYVPGMLLLSPVVSRVVGEKNGSFAVFVCWAVAFGVTGSRMIYWKCPRCRKWFHAKWWLSSPFARRCVNCKLRKWAEPSDHS